VWRSTNVKASSATSVSWTKISSFGSSNTLRVIEQSPADVNVLYVARSGALYRSDNVNSASPTWTDLSSNLPNNTLPTDIEAHPTNQNIVYMTQSNNVYKSLNKGATWTDISANLPNISTNCIVYDTTSNEGLYVGTDFGVYYKDASMLQWVSFSTGLPTSGEVTELEIYYDSNPLNSRLTAATYGRGLWQSDLYTSASTNTINFSASSNSILVGDSIDFTDMSSPNPSSWQWTFYGGTPSTSNLQNPVNIKYNATGVYDVKLVATTVNGTDSLVKTNYITVNIPNPYCAASSTTCDEYIGNVAVGTINNTSLCGNYTDYTSTHSTNMTIGNSYSLTVSNPVTYSGDQCGVWVDWNQDGDFYDANESLNVIGGPGTFTSTIIPPSSAVIGATRMRIRVMYTGTVSPCGTTSYGEVEDYTVVVQSAAANMVISPSSHSVTSAAGSVQFFLASNVSWSALSNSGWLSLSPSSGSGNATAIATYSANTSSNPRTATITFSGSGVSNQIVTVTQAGLSGVLTVSPSNQNVGAASGYTAFTVNSNISWSATDNASWLSLSPASATGNGMLTATFTANTSANPRTATITFTGSGVSNQIVTVTQAGVTQFLTISPTSQNVSAAAGNTNFTISSNVAWSASDNASWLSLSPLSGNGNGTLTATYTANTTSNPRAAIITLTGTGVNNQTVTFIQAGGSSLSLVVSPPNQNVGDAAGSTNFTITSNVAWSATDDATWLSLSPASGNGNGTLTATFTANTTVNPRTATLTFTGSGVSNQTVTVTQAGITANLSISPPSQNVASSAGNTSFNILSNTSWSAVTNATWLSLNPTSGNGNGMLTATFTANTSANSRTGTITVSANGASQTATVVQAGSSNYLTITPVNQNATAAAGSKTYTINSNVSWTLSDDQSWLTVSPDTGSGNATITATYSANSNSGPRIATITVVGNGISANQQATLTQASLGFYMIINPMVYDIGDTSGLVEFNVSSNTNWNAISSDNWLSINPTSGFGNDTIIATFTANPNYDLRKGYITINAQNVGTQLLTVNQEGFGVGISEKSKGFIKIYPNPVKELLYINTSDDNKYQLKLFNVLGEVLYLNEFKSSENIDVSKFAKGIYFLEVNKTSGDFERVVRKIVVE
ncbi:MAG: T9SS type A sorting domain-containing protein, partial [Saprospiraceae bacterium]|nr:T9SS type A sorting domain-containing protein [Saprospiraceae bacterium]